MSGQANRILANTGYWLLIVSVFGAVLLPPIELVSSLPTLELSDITFPILFGVTIFRFKTELLGFYKANRLWVRLVAIFVALTGLSIIVNGRYFSYRDWFEPIKYIKLFSFVLFFYLFTNKEQLMRFLKAILVTLLIFNILHYFNIFEFNKHIEPFYAAPHHLDFFGLNSIGEPATKRMIGTLGNPNNNAILFLVFLLIFLPKAKPNREMIVWSCLAIFALFACQSRTAFLAFVVLMGVYPFALVKNHRWVALVFVGFAVLSYLILQLMGNSYLGTVVDSQYLESAGIGRIEQWRRIIAAMPGHWIFGQGVNKAYFESHGIYAESEYFLVLFRYGIIGLLSFLSIWSLLFIQNLKRLRTETGILIVGIIIIFGITGLTNSPMSTAKLPLMLALVLGVGLKLSNEKTGV